VGEGNVRDRLDLRDVEDAEIGSPTVKPEHRAYFSNTQTT
jgi:hypothetical protein